MGLNAGTKPPNSPRSFRTGHEKFDVGISSFTITSERGNESAYGVYGRPDPHGGVAAGSRRISARPIRVVRPLRFRPVQLRKIRGHRSPMNVSQWQEQDHGHASRARQMYHQADRWTVRRSSRRLDGRGYAGAQSMARLSNGDTFSRPHPSQWRSQRMMHNARYPKAMRYLMDNGYLNDLASYGAENATDDRRSQSKRWLIRDTLRMNMHMGA